MTIRKIFILFNILACLLLSTISVYAMTPPSSDELIEGIKNYRVPEFSQSYGEDNISILDNTDALFIYDEKKISEIESEDDIRELIEKSN